MTSLRLQRAAKRLFVFIPFISLNLACAKATEDGETTSRRADRNGEASEATDTPKNPLASIPLRNIGPAYPSGRISDFAMFKGGAQKYFAATASGGLWLTENNGATWTPTFDGEASYSIGVVEIAPGDQTIVWVGSGENNAQRSVAYGDGVYKSVDGGKTWKNMGLKDSGHISQIWIHPENADVVLVAAQGPLWSDGGDRGLYKTEDGGATWRRILEVDEHTGINEFVVHPDDHDRIVASSYQRRRHVWTLINGGPGSGIHHTEDGGATWSKVESGLPKEEMGRIGLAGAASAQDTVYAIIEAGDEETGVYRSVDFGRSWEKRSGHATTSPQYYNEIFVDPLEANRLYSLDTFSKVSEDGGKTFTNLSADHRHVDDHALWIDPANTAHLMMGGDGGIYESWDRGQKWRHINNLPIVQFYRIQPDNDLPFYNVCGGTQDNNSLCGPSRTAVVHGVTNADWKIILGGDGYKPQIDPTDPNIIYTQYQYGGLARYDRRTQERLYITPPPPSGEPAYKWNWNTPLLISPHDPKTIYYAAERLFRSPDRGDSWEIISPDVTRNVDRNELDVMGRVWSVDAVAKNDSTSFYGSIIGLSESPLVRGLIYVGTDDGVISVTEDDGETWRSTETFPGVPDMSLVEDIIASVNDDNVAYAVFDNHKRGDYAPYVYKTSDRGRTWVSIAGDLPKRGSAHTIAEDHDNPDLLFVGTEFGLFTTQDGGKTWVQMKKGMPTIAVRDLEIQRRENDLVIGTFGRGVYIADDYRPLRTPAAAIADAEATLFDVKDPWLYVEGDLWGTWGGAQAFNGDNFYFAENPPFGAVFTYHLKDALTTKEKARREREKKIAEEKGDTPYPSWDALRTEDREDAPKIILTVRNAEGAVIRRIEGPTEAGLHRVAWDLRHDHPAPVSLDDGGDSPFADPPVGPLAVPGAYTVRLSKRVEGAETDLGAPQTFTVKPLDRSPEATSDRPALLAFQERTSALSRRIFAAERRAADVSTRIAHLKKAIDRTPAATTEHYATLAALEARYDDINAALNGDGTRARRNEPEPWSITQRIDYVRGSSWRSQSAPAAVHEDAVNVAEAEFAAVSPQLEALVTDLAAFETALAAAGAPWTPGQGLAVGAGRE
ncbi:MAG: glycosyl hydrolase [Alphaproteobacteria bacterium]|nr:glycosyl hydrolase [Alphaproteobacteria bacterium]